MDADDVEAFGANVLKLMRSFRPHHDNIAGTDLEFLTIRSDARLPAANDPRLRIGMLVEVRPCAGLVMDKEKRNTGTVGLPLKPNCASRGRLDFAGSNDLIHEYNVSFLLGH